MSGPLPICANFFKARTAAVGVISESREAAMSGVRWALLKVWQLKIESLSYGLDWAKDLTFSQWSFTLILLFGDPNPKLLWMPED